MDRRNGGDPLAPPRPPKLLPRVHRPRAPEPTVMSETTATTTTTTTPQRTNNLNSNNNSSSSNSSNNNFNINHNNNHHSSQQQQQQLLHSITTTTNTTTTNSNNNNINNNNIIHSNNNNINSNISNNNTNVAIISPVNEFDDYQIHHLTYLPQRPSSLSRNSSHVSNTSSSNVSITAVNSFIRRPLPPTPGGAVPLLSNITGSTGNSSSNINSNNNFLSHFQSFETAAPASPVTLAQPRPESERLTNEYVDTPLRSNVAALNAAQQLQLQHATRAQHPAGQQDNGQTTTHHLLLLPQRELRQQHQQQQQQQQLHQIHSTSNRLAAAAGSAATTQTGTDGTDGFLHSHTNHNHQQQQHHHQQQLTHAAINGHAHVKFATASSGVGATTTTPPNTITSATTLSSSGTTATTGKCPHASGKLTPPPPAPPRNTGFAAAAFAGAQPITQPITKQPASSQQHATKDVHSLDELLDMHHMQASGNNGQLGAPIIIGDPSLLSPIVCPRCGRCRCEQCQGPRPLPQTWVCNKTCLCSAESIIDYASCLCCAKALFYHCARDNDMDCDDGSGTPCVDNPCSCGPYKRTQRWCWLGALSLALPCLWCYWPMRGCVKLCELCYGRVAGRGCRCQGNGTASIVPLSVNGNSMNGVQNGNNGSIGGIASTGKSINDGHHSSGRSECSAASRILRKGDLTPEKRLLDSSPDY